MKNRDARKEKDIKKVIKTLSFFALKLLFSAFDRETTNLLQIRPY